MSLGIAFKGPEGIVLAADSRVTLTTLQPGPQGQQLFLPSTFDNATKLLKLQTQDHVGAVTYGLGAIGQQSPRTAHSFLPEFDKRIESRLKGQKISVAKFADELSSFFMEQWKNNMSAIQVPMDMVFLVGGIDEDAVYGSVFEFSIPNNPKPVERFAKPEEFGVVWGGQREYVDRLLQAYDPRVLDVLATELKLDPPKIDVLKQKLATLATPIPYQFLPLQDSVDLSIFLIRTTMRLQTWTVGVRGVGGAIDVATITKTDKFQAIQIKRVEGEARLDSASWKRNLL